MGYTGGQNKAPTYQSVCRGDGHTEAVKVTFDPSVITYEQLMRRVVHEAHPHMTKAQYQSAVWTQTPEEEAIARRVAHEMNKDALPVLPAAETQWWDAEEYHQKYYEKQNTRLPTCARRR